LISILEDIAKIKSTRKELREFGFTIGAALIVLSGLALWRGKGSCSYLFISGLIFAALGAALPAVLKPLQKAWMAFSVVIGFFMSRVVLAALFYSVKTYWINVYQKTGRRIGANVPPVKRPKRATKTSTDNLKGNRASEDRYIERALGIHERAQKMVASTHSHSACPSGAAYSPH
jgi:small basic protein